MGVVVLGGGESTPQARLWRRDEGGEELLAGVGDGGDATE